MIIYQRLQSLMGCLSHGIPSHTTYRTRIRHRCLLVYFQNINFLHINAGSHCQLMYRPLTGYHVRSSNSARTQVQVTQPYSRYIAYPSSTIDLLYTQIRIDTVPHGTLLHCLKVQVNTYSFVREIPTHLSTQFSEPDMWKYRTPKELFTIDHPKILLLPFTNPHFIPYSPDLSIPFYHAQSFLPALRSTLN